jgi:CPA2 family monovalent cation:H+ antiporter-2
VHSFDLIVTLAGGLAAALAAGYLTHRLGLSPIVGYLFAGLLVGPYTPGFVADQHLAEQLAEVGVILLMFGVGLQFHIEELLAVRTIAIPGALVQSAVATALGTWVGRAAGWGWEASIVFGIALSVASTVVLVRVLSDNRDLHTPAGHIAIGWLVVEDILTVLILVLMPAIFGRDGGAPADGSSVWLAVLFALTKIGLLVVFTITAGGRAIPWLLTHVASTRSRELFTLTVLAVALGIAVVSAKIFGVSMALGAFLAGMVVGRSDFSVRAASEAMPMRDAFAVLFFVSVGMLLDPAQLLQQPMRVLLTLAVVLIGKPAAALAIAALFRQTLKVSLSVAVALAQIGEFSFIVATLGNSLGVLPPAATQILVAAAIVSITINPLLYRSVDSLARRFGRQDHVTAAAGQDQPESQYRAIVVGYGPIGRTVGRLLRENDITPTIIELNMDTVRQLRQEGMDAIYGDASQSNTLTSAGTSGARSIIISVAGMPGVEETIRVARELNPNIQTLARTSNLREASDLRSAGADVVFSGEGEVALAFTEAILENLGATPDQIQRERARVHAELT